MNLNSLFVDTLSILNRLEGLAFSVKGLFRGKSFDKLEKYKSLKIDNKIEDKYSLLKRKIKHYVSEYYLFIEEQLRNLDEKEKKFKIIANQINTAYLSCCTEDKDDVFNNIVNWLNSKDVTLNYDACVIVVSFFVQNCEVFDEVA